MKTVSQLISADKELFALVATKPAAAEKRKAAVRKKDLPRNYSQEEIAAQATLFDAMVDYRTQRNTGVPVQLVQIAQALILCGLPYRATQSREHTRVSRAADGSMIRVRFHAMGKDENDNPIPMAFGSDRTFLHWCIDKAIKGYGNDSVQNGPLASGHAPKVSKINALEPPRLLACRQQESNKARDLAKNPAQTSLLHC